MWGFELKYKDNISRFARFYASFFGNPALGEAIRQSYFTRLTKNIDLKNKTILDAGCGWGPYTFYLAKKFPTAKIYSCDFEKEGVERAKKIANKMGLKNITFFQQDLTLLDFKDKFDFIVCVDVLEHIDEDRKVVNNFNAALKTGGILYVNVPRDRYFGTITKKKANYLAKFPEHVRPGYNKNSMASLIEGNGLKIQRILYSWRLIAQLFYDLHGFTTRNSMLAAITAPFLKPFLFLDYYCGDWGNNVTCISKKP